MEATKNVHVLGGTAQHGQVIIFRNYEIDCILTDIYIIQ
jgi:hypothetical protein